MVRAGSWQGIRIRNCGKEGEDLYRKRTFLGAATLAVVAPSHQPVMPILHGAGIGDLQQRTGELGMKRSLFGAAALAVVALTAVLIGTASAAKPPPAPTNTSCPTNRRRTFPTSNIVGASVSVSGATARTLRLVHGSGPDKLGTPGLVNYCVYTTAAPTAVTARPSRGRTGVSGRHPSWARTSGSPAPVERRPTSSSTGTGHEVGTATWTVRCSA